jgi:hypothetical protein
MQQEILVGVQERMERIEGTTTGAVSPINRKESVAS